MTKELDLLNKFCDQLAEQGKRKAKMYDGIGENDPNPRLSINDGIRFLIEEAGEVASAITRDRTELAKAECLDVAHCAFLIYLTLENSQNDKIL